MDDTLRTKMQEDIERAKAMTDINSAVDVLELSNRLIGYLDLVMTEKAKSEYLTAQLKGKQRTLEEYVRTSKERYKELSILEYKQK